MMVANLLTAGVTARRREDASRGFASKLEFSTRHDDRPILEAVSNLFRPCSSDKL